MCIVSSNKCQCVSLPEPEHETVEERIKSNGKFAVGYIGPQSGETSNLLTIGVTRVGKRSHIMSSCRGMEGVWQMTTLLIKNVIYLTS